MKSSTLAKKIGFYAMIIIVWQGLDSADIWPDNIFPSPVDVVEDLA
jgi:NitT/TauT family transport system permease protein